MLIRRARSLRRCQRGVTLVELLVAASLAVVVVTGSLLAVFSAAKVLRQTQDGAAAGFELSQAADLMDRSLPYAAEVNLPIRAGGSTFLEYRVEQADPGVLDQCYQWRLAADGRLEVRSWPVGSAATGWLTVIRSVDTGAGRPEPFQVRPATADRPTQQVEVQLARLAEQGVTSRTVTFTAANSSVASVTNLDANSDGVSDTQVCTEWGRP